MAMRARWRRLSIGVALAALTLLGAAALTRRSWAAGMMVLAPSPDGAAFDLPPDAHERIEIVRPTARIRAWVFDPAEAPRGTVLVLHGIRSSKLSSVAAARAHVRSGLRAVAVDSRGHGESAGRYLTYGVEEGRDLRALVDELDRRGLLTPPLDVVGSSYGAATAIQYAAIDSRVERVVASASFSSLREVVPAYLHWKLGPLADFVPSAVVNDLIDGATAQANFSADAACPRCVAPRVRARVLLIHSRDDERIPWQHSSAIHAALRSPKELMLVQGVGHVATNNAPGVADAISRFLARR